MGCTTNLFMYTGTHRLTNSALVYEPKCANEYSCAHGAQINFGDLTPYLTLRWHPFPCTFIDGKNWLAWLRRGCVYPPLVFFEYTYIYPHEASNTLGAAPPPPPPSPRPQKKSLKLVKYPPPPTGIGERYSQPPNHIKFQIYAKQHSCADMNSP